MEHGLEERLLVVGVEPREVELRLAGVVAAAVVAVAAAVVVAEATAASSPSPPSSGTTVGAAAGATMFLAWSTFFLMESMKPMSSVPFRW